MHLYVSCIDADINIYAVLICRQSTFPAIITYGLLLSHTDGCPVLECFGAADIWTVMD